MKPTSTGNRHFPFVDWNYKSENQPASSAASPINTVPALHKLTGNVAADFTRDYFAELTAFVAITAVSAWPVFLSAVAIVRMIRGY